MSLLTVPAPKATLVVGLGAVAAAGLSALWQLSRPTPGRKKPNSAAKDRGLELFVLGNCPVSMRTRSVLDYFGVPWTRVDVNPRTFEETEWSGAHPPVLRAADQTVCRGPREIVAYVLTVLSDDGVLDSATAAHFFSDAAQRRTQWVMDELVRVSGLYQARSLSESLRCYAYALWAPAFSLCERMRIVVVMGWRMARNRDALACKLGVSDPRRVLFGRLHAFIDEAIDGPGHAFAGGRTPDMGDFAVYGIVRATENMHTHSELCRDAQLGPWVERMEKIAGTSSMLSAR
mmetsp:Transcript_15863/g.48474  ORF Transcript_15863/g.48474 Transcript_15863/m.48474 type:complete len:289 (+) Transcript_15863:55-921(+)